MRAMRASPSYSAFNGNTHVATGSLADVGLALKRAVGADGRPLREWGGSLPERMFGTTVVSFGRPIGCPRLTVTPPVHDVPKGNRCSRSPHESHIQT